MNNTSIRIQFITTKIVPLWITIKIKNRFIRKSTLCKFQSFFSVYKVSFFQKSRTARKTSTNVLQSVHFTRTSILLLNVLDDIKDLSKSSNQNRVHMHKKNV